VLDYVTITGTFEAADGTGLDGVATFCPGATVYDSSGPVVFADVPVQALITAGQLQALDGSPLQLLATDNSVTVEGPSPEWLWSVTVSVTAGASTSTDSWEFALPHSPDTVDLYSTRNPA
jgi:hypothetical protein